MQKGLKEEKTSNDPNKFPENPNYGKLIEEEKKSMKSPLLEPIMPHLENEEFYGVSRAYGNSFSITQSPPEEIPPLEV